MCHRHPAQKGICVQCLGNKCVPASTAAVARKKRAPAIGWRRDPSKARAKGRCQFPSMSLKPAFLDKFYTGPDRTRLCLFHNEVACLLVYVWCWGRVARTTCGLPLLGQQGMVRNPYLKLAQFQKQDRPHSVSTLFPYWQIAHFWCTRGCFPAHPSQG